MSENSSLLGKDHRANPGSEMNCMPLEVLFPGSEKVEEIKWEKER